VHEQSFFYTNDVFVIVDILNRRIYDAKRGESVSLFEPYCCCQADARWS